MSSVAEAAVSAVSSAQGGSALAATVGKSFCISSYCKLLVEVGESATTVRLEKTPYGKVPVSAILTMAEFNALGKILPSMRATADQMFQQLQTGGLSENAPTMRQSIQVLSDVYAFGINFFRAPDSTYHLTNSIRKYFRNADNVLTMKKEAGVTLTYAEICSVHDIFNDVMRYIQETLASIKLIVLKCQSDCDMAIEFVTAFYRFGTGRARLVLERPRTLPALPTPPPIVSSSSQSASSSSRSNNNDDDEPVPQLVPIDSGVIQDANVSSTTARASTPRPPGGGLAGIIRPYEFDAPVVHPPLVITDMDVDATTAAAIAAASACTI